MKTYCSESIDTLINYKGVLDLKIIFICIVMGMVYFLYKSDTKTRIYTIGIITMIHIILYWFYTKKTKKLETNNKKISYNNLKKVVKTGDIILFKTNDSWDLPEFYFYRLLPTVFLNNHYSHTSMVIKHKGKLYILESSESPVLDVNLKREKNGVRIVDFESRIKDYNGIIGFKKNSINMQKYLDKIVKHVNKYYETPFTKDIISPIIINMSQNNNKILDPFYTKNNGIGCIPFITDLFRSIGIYDRNSILNKGNIVNMKSSIDILSDAYTVI